MSSTIEEILAEIHTCNNGDDCRRCDNAPAHGDDCDHPREEDDCEDCALDDNTGLRRCDVREPDYDAQIKDEKLKST